jgi:lantibiotic modifying enzyme
VIKGAAGCMGGVLSLYRCAPSERTLGVAVQCGDRLIACSQATEQGIAWHTVGMRQPLTGFSHGAAGMAWALLELYAHTGAERFRTAALHAIAYERSLFVPEVGNWLDLREHEAGKPAGVEGERRYMTSWCHGAPGIGLARLQALPYVDDAIIHVEIDTALQTTRTQGFGRNHSLCHGDLGNLEFLLQASTKREGAPGCAQVYHLAEQILESICTHGWRCGTSFGVESPGFMTGLAGIGYAWLRLAEPTRVPSVLMLAPPLHCAS